MSSQVILEEVPSTVQGFQAYESPRVPLIRGYESSQVAHVRGGREEATAIYDSLSRSCEPCPLRARCVPGFTEHGWIGDTVSSFFKGKLVKESGCRIPKRQDGSLEVNLEMGRAARKGVLIQLVGD